MTKDTIAKAGDVRINKVVVITSKGMAQDITMQAIGFDIFEDIFSPFITGKIYVRDSQEITNLLPLVGEETVELSITTPELAEEAGFTQQFCIFKMTEKENTSQREAVYTLHIISREAILDMNQLISRCLSGPISGIVTDILKKDWGLASKKKCNVDEDIANKTKFVANFWSPIRCIQYAAEHAVSKGGSPNYLFFENKYGLNFVSLDDLYDLPVMHEFIKDQYSSEIGADGGSGRNIAEDYKRVLDLRQPVAYNYMERLKSGFYGSEIVYMDLLTGQYVHTAFQPDFGGKHLNKYPLYTDRVSARPKGCLIQGNQNYNNFDGYGSDTANTKTVQKRQHLMATAEASKCIITVFGRTDYAAGQKVSLRIPQNTQLSKDDTEWGDRINSGNYLISAVCHSIDRESYTCIMELIKDSYVADLGKL